MASPAARCDSVQSGRLGHKRQLGQAAYSQAGPGAAPEKALTGVIQETNIQAASTRSADELVQVMG
jgi:hypothetical protein